MCGIVGAVAQRDVVDILVEGLRRLEYRGYDSAGVAVIDGHTLQRVRRLGKDNPERLRDAAREHAAIALAIANGNPAVASAATTVHLDNSLRHLLGAASPSSLPLV